MKQKILSVMLAMVLAVTMTTPVMAQERTGDAGIETVTVVGETAEEIKEEQAETSEGIPDEMPGESGKTDVDANLSGGGYEQIPVTVEEEAPEEIGEIPADTTSGEPENPIDVAISEYASISMTTPTQDSEGYYLIDSKEKLYWFAGLVNGTLTDGTPQDKNANARLMADITINEDLTTEMLTINGDDGTATEVNGTPEVWMPISNTTNGYDCYSGTFDGGHHTISGIYCNGGAYYGGLFGLLRTTAKIMDVGIVDSYISGTNDTGSICGRVNDSSVTISGCYNTGYVNGKGFVGGISGSHNGNDGRVINCYNSGSVFNSDSGGYTGGITGNGKPQNCYNIGTIHATGNTGGVTGVSVSTNCYYLDTCGAAGSGTSKTSDEFVSGEVAWLLNGGETQVEPLVWFQNIDGTEKDVYPTLDSTHGTVYKLGSSYSNSDGAPSKDAEGNYLIGSKENLYWFANAVNSGQTSINAKLTANITINSNVLKPNGDLNGDGSDFEVWTPIGTSSKKYAGIFDGQDHVIKGLYYNDTSASNVGLFGFSTGSIKNIIVEDSYIGGKDYIGGICGQGNADHCTNAGTVVAFDTRAGGICGKGTVTNSNNMGNIISGTCAGGIIGQGTAIGCQNSGTITGTKNVGGTNAGGIAGYIETGSVKHCFNTGSINGITNIGGVAGRVDSYGTTKVEYCWNAGTVTASGSNPALGDVVGTVENSSKLSNCYYQADSETDSYSGTTFKTAAQFATGEVAWLLNGGETQTSPLVWFQNIDGTEKDAYPILDNTHGTVYKLGSSYSNSDGAPSKDAEGYYLIGSKENLYWFANAVNDGQTSINAKLTANITVNSNVLGANGDLNGSGSSFEVWTPIGNFSQKYAGTFDGQGHTVSGLYFNDTDNPSGNYVGLFGCINAGGKIQNVGVIDSYINGFTGVGGICGYVAGANGSITGCWNGSTVCGQKVTGGIAGSMTGHVENCYNFGKVSSQCIAYEVVGGICGQINRANGIVHCYNSGTVSDDSVGKIGNAGAICGAVLAENSASAKDSYSLEGTCEKTIGSDQKNLSTNVSFKTAAEFASGEVAWLLNGGEDQAEDPVWFQNVDGTDKDAYPTLDSTHGKIYRTGTEGSYIYTNTKPGVTFDVSFDTDGGSTVATQTVADGETASKPAPDPTKEGYTFEGWYADEELSTPFDFEHTAITQDTTIYAKWIVIHVHNGVLQEGNAATCTAPGTKEHYKCEGCGKLFSDADCMEPVTEEELVLPAAGHKPSDEWKKNAEGHWKVCSVCEKKVSEAGHDGDPCSVCGYETDITPPVHEHTPDSTWHKDIVGHWHVCTGCGEKLGFEEHRFKDAVCSICGYKLKDTTTGGEVEDDENIEDDPVRYQTVYEAKSIASCIVNRGKALPDKTYNGMPQTQKITVVMDGKTLKEGTDYKLLYENNVNVGEAAVFIVGAGAYKGSVPVTFTIKGKPLNKLQVLTDQVTVGKVTDNPIHIFDGQYELVLEEDYNYMFTSAEKGVNNVTILPVAGSNYAEGTKPLVAKVTGVELNAESGGKLLKPSNVTLSKDGWSTVDGILTTTYDGTVKVPDVTVKDGDTVLKKGTDYTVSFKNNKNAGTAYAIVKGKGKVYKGKVTAVFTIKTPDISFSSVKIGKGNDLTFTGKLQTPAVVVRVKGADGKEKKLAKNKDYVLHYVSNINHGQGYVTVTGIGNYAGVKGTYVFNILQKDINKVTKSINKVSKIILKFGGKTLEEGEGKDYTVRVEDSAKAGKKKVTITGHGNYTGSFSKDKVKPQ